MTNYPELRLQYQSATNSIQKTIARQISDWASTRNIPITHTTGLIEIVSDDAFVLRFLKYHKFQVPITESVILEHLEWRLTHDIPLLSFSSVPSGTRTYLHDGLVQFYGRDTEGRPLMLVNLARLKGGSVEDLRIFALFVFECARRMLKALNDYNDQRELHDEREVSFIAQVSIVVDLEGLNYHNMRLDAIPVILSLFQKHIPGMVAIVHVLGYSWWHSGPWAIIKTAIPSEIAKKLQFVERNALTEHIIDVESVLERLGPNSTPYRFLEDRFYADYGITAELYVKARPGLLKAYEVVIGAVHQEEIIENSLLEDSGDGVATQHREEPLITKKSDDPLNGACIENVSLGHRHSNWGSSTTTTDTIMSVLPGNPIYAKVVSPGTSYRTEIDIKKLKRGIIPTSKESPANGSVKSDEESEDLWYDALENIGSSNDGRKTIFEKVRSSAVPVARSSSAPARSSASNENSVRKKSTTLSPTMLPSSDKKKTPLLSLKTHGTADNATFTSSAVKNSSLPPTRGASTNSPSASPVVQVSPSDSWSPSRRSSLVTRLNNQSFVTDDGDWTIISPTSPSTSNSGPENSKQNGPIIHHYVNTHNAYNQSRRNSTNSPLKSATSHYDPPPQPPYVKVLGDYGQGNTGPGNRSVLRKGDESIVPIISVSAITMIALWVARRSVLNSLEHLVGWSRGLVTGVRSWMDLWRTK